MGRLISCALTIEPVETEIKDVTRRVGWWTDKNGRRIISAGDRLTACKKVQGRRRADGTVEPLVRLREVEVVNVRREPLGLLSGHVDPARFDLPADYPETEVAREGFPGMRPSLFVSRFFVEAQNILPTQHITRIEWRYVCGHGRCFCGNCPEANGNGTVPAAE